MWRAERTVSPPRGSGSDTVVAMPFSAGRWRAPRSPSRVRGSTTSPAPAAACGCRPSSAVVRSVRKKRAESRGRRGRRPAAGGRRTGHRQVRPVRLLLGGGHPLGHSPDRARDRDACGLTRQEVEVVRMLSQGLTDETVAKHFSVSARTARLIAAELMDKPGARSRFQAGARAVAKGSLSGEE
ncbi:hypothetical protein DMH12_02090 [Streptomyces sp. WAC 04229]|nr:hypothetical protein DMH12_02090 [Streptomyces sp. WAC 04229]